MSEKRSLLVGFDLCNDYSQITCYNTLTFEPESICQSDDKNQYLIPTVIGVKSDTKDWVYGKEAIELQENEKGVFINDILQRIIDKEDITIYDVTFTGTTILERFLRKCFTLLKRYYPNESIQKIMFTVKEQSPLLRESIYMALLNLGLTSERVSVQSHSQSYLYFALSQKKELWINDVGLFDFDEQGLHYSQISINRRMNPILVKTTDKEYAETLSYELLKESSDLENISYMFENIAKSALHKQIVSTLYMVGIGFDGDWADEIFASLCVGRRVFKGQNLYAKGACYAAKETTGEGKLNEFLFISEEMIQCDIVINVYNNAKKMELVIAKASIPWYESEKSVDLILDQEEEIEIITRNIMTQKESRQMITLEGITNKPNKSVRVHLKANFVDVNSCVITVKDVGFGEFYPSTNRIWEKVIHLE